MKIFQSQSSFELVVVLTEAEALLYREVFRNQMCVAIPELDDKKFVIKEIGPYNGEGAPEKSWHLVIKQEEAERTTHSTTFGVSDHQPLEVTAGNTHH
jgi:hypothetical protein